MEKKEYLKRLVLPLALTVLVCVGFFLFMSFADELFPFDDHLDMAYHSESKINSADTVSSMEELNTVASNTLVGKLKYNDTQLDVVYDCSDVNLEVACNLVDWGNCVGDVGCAYIYGYKSNMQPFTDMAVGDTVTVEMQYGTYQYKCVDKQHVLQEWQVLGGDYQLSHGLVIYSDDSTGVGVTGNYNVVVLEMV